MVLAATLVMLICNTFRIPYAFLGAIRALLIPRESIRSTLTSAGTILFPIAAAVIYILVFRPICGQLPPPSLSLEHRFAFLAFYMLSEQ